MEVILSVIICYVRTDFTKITFVNVPQIHTMEKFIKPYIVAANEAKSAVVTVLNFSITHLILLTAEQVFVLFTHCVLAEVGGITFANAR